jgi:hypothetical protein
MNQITNLLVLLLLISFIMPVTAITHAQDNEIPCLGGYCAHSPQETPNRGGPTENTTSDVASNSTINVQQQNSSTGSTP